MPSGSFSKTAAPYLVTKINSGNGDTVLGGSLTAAPTGTTAQQFLQNLPGDRFIFSPLDALAISNNTVGTLYTGTYRYVLTNNSTSAPTRGHGGFWLDATGANNGNLDGTYTVSSDEAANFGVVQFAGVFISTITKTNYCFIQESGKATCAFRNAITGTPAIAAGVYLAGAGNNANAVDVGAFDQLAAANSAAIFTANSTTGYTTVDNMLIRYVGPALTLPANNNTALVDITLSRASFRW